MRTSPVVSVVMPVGRVDRELEDQLDALGAQDFDDPWELVLALNTSDPPQQRSLRELAGRHARARVVDAFAVRSASHARNRGAEEAAADVLAFCDADDIADPGWLKALVADVAPGVAVGGHLDETRLAVAGQEHWRPPATPGALPTFLGSPYLVSANMAVHRRDFSVAGGFDTDLSRCEDIALSFELVRSGVELRYVPDAVIHYRHRKGMREMLRQHYRYGIGLAEVLARYGLPGTETGRSVVATLRPNAQAVERWSAAHVLRRAALASGRVVGAVRERRRR